MDGTIEHLDSELARLQAATVAARDALAAVVGEIRAEITDLRRLLASSR